MKNIFSFIIIFLLFSCKKENNIVAPVIHENVITMNSISDNYDSITTKVKKLGDEDAYSELFYHLKDSNFEGRTDSLMIYSKIMAEKYHFEKAYIDYLDAVTEKHGIENNIGNYSTINLSQLKSKEKQEIIDWLSKMVEKGIITEKQFQEVKK
ncbi:hypothetical protein NZD85_02100 [Empedobacter stercoris]|uniref:hypothetical protein n=2 Tax=Empedobacter TaxID=59734 RepID=UPI0021AF0C83|nr:MULTISPECIES: hypothetical protein [Empedobacter]MDM1521959.1 hypothetical protein [Empedobacter sp. 225-1]MDM1542228.1 hypothetical protein [Empedobacter sp. 189-2]UWX67414.1 hypothetical protein NZD85_02100 [Empedobacter stercoris]